MTKRTPNRPLPSQLWQGFESIAEIEKANKAAGFYFFEPDSMRFFRSRVGSSLFGGRYFVTSEQRPGCSRRYTVREARPGGDIDNNPQGGGGFQGFDTLRQAEACAKHLAETVPAPVVPVPSGVDGVDLVRGLAYGSTVYTITRSRSRGGVALVSLLVFAKSSPLYLKELTGWGGFPYRWDARRQGYVVPLGGDAVESLGGCFHGNEKHLATREL